MLEKRDFYINGKWVAPAKANDFAVIDPSTEEQCAVISLGDQADTDAAVAAARAAFDGWSQTPSEERMALIANWRRSMKLARKRWRRPCRWKWAHRLT